MEAAGLALAVDGFCTPYVASHPLVSSQDGSETRALCIPIMRRAGGFLLALPSGCLSAQALAEGLDADPNTVFGPSTSLTVQAVEEAEDGSEILVAEPLELMIVDLSDVAAPYLAAQLVSLSRAWLRTASEALGGFYSAHEPEEPATPAKGAGATTPGPAPKAKPKRVTTALLAEQLQSLLQLMPAMSDQMQDLVQRQQQLESRVSEVGTTPPVPLHRQQFKLPTAKGPPVPGLSPFATSLGPPPKVREPPRLPAPVEANPVGLPEVPATPLASPSDAPPALMSALQTQGEALTALVNHLISQASEASADFGGAPGSSASLSSKGSAKREKLQEELAASAGAFMLAVAQNGFRRMYPSMPVPRDLEALMQEPRAFQFSQYLERYGGYQQQRDLGVMMFMLCQVADLMLAGNYLGAMDRLALVMVAVEQAAQDAGRWEVAYTLSLFPDPPHTVFQSRGTPYNPRVRAWAPLCPTPWATVALAYLKEADSILARRTEANAGAAPPKGADDGGEQPKRPRRPRFPKAPKQDK